MTKIITFTTFCVFHTGPKIFALVMIPAFLIGFALWVFLKGLEDNDDNDDQKTPSVDLDPEIAEPGINPHSASTVM